MQNWQYHYKMAERLLERAAEENRVIEWKTAIIDEALVHATLAKIGYEGPPEPIQLGDYQ